MIHPNQPPTPPRRNPFKAGSALARQYDAMLKAYADGSRDVLRQGARALGNSLSAAFWRGYDNTSTATVVPSSFAWAAYRAGQRQRLIDNERGVFVPPAANRTRI